MAPATPMEILRRNRGMQSSSGASEGESSVADALLGAGSAWGTVVDVFKKAASSVVNVLAVPDEDEYSALYGHPPAQGPTPDGQIIPGAAPEGCVRYRCGTDETFAGIAMKFNMRVSELEKLNRICTKVPLNGQIILVRQKPNAASSSVSTTAIPMPPTVVTAIPFTPTPPPHSPPPSPQFSIMSRLLNSRLQAPKNVWTSEVIRMPATYIRQPNALPQGARSPPIRPPSPSRSPRSPEKFENSLESRTVLRIRGQITLSSSLLVFDPFPTEHLVKKFGMAAFQLHLSIATFTRSVVDGTDGILIAARPVPRNHRRTRGRNLHAETAVSAPLIDESPEKLPLPKLSPILATFPEQDDGEEMVVDAIPLEPLPPLQQQNNLDSNNKSSKQPDSPQPPFGAPPAKPRTESSGSNNNNPSRMRTEDTTSSDDGSPQPETRQRRGQSWSAGMSGADAVSEASSKQSRGTEEQKLVRKLQKQPKASADVTYEFRVEGASAEESVVRLHTRIHVLMMMYNENSVTELSHPMNQHTGTAVPKPTPLARVEPADENTPKESAVTEYDFHAELDEPSDILTREHVDMLSAALPPSYQFCDFYLAYSLYRHGISLQTFFRNTADRGPSIIVIKDNFDHVFGGFASEEWRNSQKYYGTGESFVFTLSPEPTLYHWTESDNRNEYFVISNFESISMGGGGHCAFTLDRELLNGSSDFCQTFSSPCLAGGKEFQCMALEVWCFTPPPKRLGDLNK
eukprot:c18922_g1_i2.p1 GENE.c18922_g1_i2~~c18922_g1_i2.p1  ORF type:complete len:742 (+),score=138.58 c18922_g1_i2:224-2449(+)